MRSWSAERSGWSAYSLIAFAPIHFVPPHSLFPFPLCEGDGISFLLFAGFSTACVLLYFRRLRPLRIVVGKKKKKKVTVRTGASVLEDEFRSIAPCTNGFGRQFPRPLYPISSARPWSCPRYFCFSICHITSPINCFMKVVTLTCHLYRYHGRGERGILLSFLLSFQGAAGECCGLGICFGFSLFSFFFFFFFFFCGREDCGKLGGLVCTNKGAL